MDQTRKRRITNRKTGLPQGKVKRVEEPEDVKAADSRDDSETTVSHRRFTKIRVSSPQSDTAGREQHTECSKTSEDDVEKALVITFDKEQGGTRLVGRRKMTRRKRDTCDEEDSQQEEGDDEIHPELEIDRELDRELENKSRQHNLTSANVRSIIHEVITNEHVVAMMKAAINETEPIPVFEPKMTRSKLKEVVEKGVVIPAWNISPIKKQTEKGTQFVDIPLEEEDSSDEEYRPDEEEEDETAEETFLESDLESTSSSPRGSRVNLHRSHSEYEEDMTGNSRLSLRRSRHLTVGVAPMGPPPPPPAPSRAPPDCSFLEKLHAVDEELAISTDFIEPYQSLTSTNADESLISLRTRSKRPLRDVPLGRLEAELRAPDFTPDMYEFGSGLEDRVWTHWLQGLMTSDMENEEEGDDEDDPEYNFLADIDEPDVEDYRNDKAVRITKKEVNDLMDEIFDAFQDEIGGQDEECHEEEEEKEEEESPPQEPPAILENIQYEDPLADVMKQRYRTVREQLAALRKRKALLESKGVHLPYRQCPTSSLTPMILSAAQKLQLQQQIQQHVQLLTQVNMLCSSVNGLETEASTSKQFLLELQMFAQRGEQSHGPVQPGFISIFSVSNLQGAISLLEELEQSPRQDPSDPSPCFPGSKFPAHLTWLMATRPVFLYLELLPVVPLRLTRFKGPFTSAENCLVVLGHKHLRSTLHPLQMTCRYLLAARSFVRLKSHIQDACQKPFPSVIKTYFMAGKCPPMPLACKRVSPCEQRPPVEREKSLMPDWLKKNLKLINEHVRNYNQPSGIFQFQTTTSAESTTPTEEANEPPGLHCSVPPGTRYPPRLPEDLSQALKLLASSKKKKVKPSESSRPSKPPLSAKELEEVLSQLPAILPKASTVACPSLSHTPHLSQGSSSQFQTVPLRPELNPCSSANGAIHCPIERPIIAPKVPLMGQSHGGVVVTLPTAPVTTELNSLRIVPVKNAVEMPIGISGAANVAQIVATQGKVLITLPTAATNAPQLSSPSSGHTTVNQTGPLVTSNVATAVPAGSSQGGLIISLPPTPIMKTSPASVPLAKDQTSQRYGTLFKLIPRDSPKQTSGSQKPLNRFLLLPPGYVVARNNHGHQIVEPVVDQNFKQVSAQEKTDGKQNRNEKTSDNHTDELQGGLLEMSSIQGTMSSIGCLQEITEEKELHSHDDGIVEIEEEEEGGERDFRELFLMLSESSGSPVGSIEEEDRDMEVVLEGKLEKQKAKEKKGSSRRNMEEEIGGDSVSEVGPVPGLLRKVSHTGLERHEGAFTREMDVERAFVLYNDTLDDDPHRDAKDVAFAQAYLEKVHEVLQAVPGKLKEFLGVLSEFERDPESRTSLELLRRLKPMLADWPELLRDFSAFLHPDQARECGLLAEQQAFERSKRFLRQLERTFGEQSALYTKVVHVLQGAPSWDLACSREMKAQISSLFCDHTDRLEEFWVFFKQLYPQVQLDSEQNENDADHLSSLETIQGLKGSQPSHPIRTLSPERKVEPHKTAIKHRRMRDKKKTKVKKHNARSNVATELDSEVDEGSSSVDNQPSSFKGMENSVCAKNILHSPNGKKVILWTREADRVILTTCRQRGAKTATFRAIAAQLGNKTTNEVLERFQDLIKLFHKSSKLPHTSQLDMEDQSSTTET